MADTDQLYTPEHHSGQLDRRLNTTNYVHPQETNLLNLTKVMEYNSQGQPVLRTTSGASIESNDSFGRLRVSNPYTLFESSHRYQDNGRIGIYTANGGTSTHNPNQSVIEASVTTDSGSLVYRESLRVFPYQPGKGLQVLQTFCFGPAKENLRIRYGYFDTNNGIYLQRDGNEVSFIIRSSPNGVPIESEKVTQANWNIDPLNGNGISTLTLNLEAVQILFIDIQWLGVGIVRVGFVIDGQLVPVHQFNHSNIIGNVTTYMGTACLPVRAEIENTGITASASTLKIICTSVISEGGFEVRGRPYCVGHTIAAPYILATPGVTYPIVSIRLKATRFGGIVIPSDFSFAVQAASNFRYFVRVGCITTGGTWVSTGAESYVEYNLTPTGFAAGGDGRLVEEGYVFASNQSSVSPSLTNFPFLYQLERNSFTNTAYEFVLCAVTDGNNQKVNGSFTWEEVN